MLNGASEAIAAVYWQVQKTFEEAKEEARRLKGEGQQRVQAEKKQINGRFNYEDDDALLVSHPSINKTL
jgi:hypothetical protein